MTVSIFLYRFLFGFCSFVNIFKRNTFMVCIFIFIGSLNYVLFAFQCMQLFILGDFFSSLIGRCPITGRSYWWIKIFKTKTGLMRSNGRIQNSLVGNSVRANLFIDLVIILLMKSFSPIVKPKIKKLPYHQNAHPNSESIDCAEK